MMGLIVDGLYKICVWITKLTYLNMLWIIFSLMGLMVFGIFPATVAMFSVLRAWIQNSFEDMPIRSIFWEAYKHRFWKANLLGFVLLIAGGGLYVDILFLQNFDGTFSMTMNSLLVLLSIIYVLVLLYIFPTFVYFDLNVLQTVKHAFLVMVMSPKATVMMIISLFILYSALFYLPGFVFVVGGSLTALAFMWLANNAFDKVLIKKEKIS